MRYPILPFPPLWPVRLTLQCWSQHSSRRLLGRCLVHSRTLLLSLLFGALLWLLLLLLLSSTAVAVVIKLKCQSQREVSATTANALFEFLLSDRQQQKEPGKEYQQQQQKLGRWQAQQTGRGGALLVAGRPNCFFADYKKRPVVSSRWTVSGRSECSAKSTIKTKISSNETKIIEKIIGRSFDTLPDTQIDNNNDNKNIEN